MARNRAALQHCCREEKALYLTFTTRHSGHIPGFLLGLCFLLVVIARQDFSESSHSETFSSSLGVCPAPHQCKTCRCTKSSPLQLHALISSKRELGHDRNHTMLQTGASLDIQGEQSPKVHQGAHQSNLCRASVPFNKRLLLCDWAKTVQPESQWYEVSVEKSAQSPQKVLLLLDTQTHPSLFYLDMLKCALSELANLQEAGCWKYFRFWNTDLHCNLGKRHGAVMSCEAELQCLPKLGLPECVSNGWQP